MPRWPEELEGMDTPNRAQRRKPETDQGGPGATTHQYSGGQGVHREVESEGHEGVSSEGWRIQWEASPTRVKVRTPVAWIVRRKETESRKPIDKAIEGW